MRDKKAGLFDFLMVICFLGGLCLLAFPLVSQVLEIQDGAEQYQRYVEQVSIPTTTDFSTTSPIEAAQTALSLILDAEITETVPVDLLLDATAEMTEYPTDMEDAASTPHPSPAPTTTAAPAKTTAPSKTAAPRPGIDLAACKADNADFIAWLDIPGTKVSYPVVQSDNTEYYLHHLFTGAESKLGTLFSLNTSDYRVPSKNIAIYGHHLSNSTAMFSTLVNYKRQDYFKKHPTITLTTFYGTRSYKIFAVLNMDIADWDPATARFASDKAFLQFADRAKKRSFYDTGVSISDNDHILTLITCDRSYGGASGRLILMAVETNEGE